MEKKIAKTGIQYALECALAGKKLTANEMAKRFTLTTASEKLAAAKEVLADFTAKNWISKTGYFSQSSKDEIYQEYRLTPKFEAENRGALYVASQKATQPERVA